MNNVQPGRIEAFEAVQVSTVKGNMLGICRMCVKSIVDKSAFESITEDCPHLDRFCTIMEHIFSHRIQARWALFGSGDQMDFWEIIHRFASAATTTSVSDMEEIVSDLGRGRAWIRLALVQKQLASFMHSLQSKQRILKAFYMPGGFIISEELSELAGNLRCLDAIDFNLCLKGQDFDFGNKKEINYAPYLVFRQNRSSVMDDTIEEHKLLNQLSEQARLKELAAGGQLVEHENNSVQELEEKAQGSVELKEIIKAERDQKNYFEELVSVRDNQLLRVQSELATAIADNEAQRNSFEAIIFELQTQVSQFQEELSESRQSQVHKKERSNSETSVASPTKRATSFLASLLGD